VHCVIIGGMGLGRLVKGEEALGLVTAYNTHNIIDL